MTENVKDQLLTSNFFSLNESVAPEASTLSEVDSSLYASSNMTVENQCIYTSTLPADIANNFPEGTVLQILPDSTILAVPPISTSADISSHSLPVTSYPTELLCGQSQPSISTLLNSSNHSESQCSEVPICTEENITDIDLSFLTEESVNTSKNLSENEVKELQTMIDIVDPNSLGILQNDPSNLMNNLASNNPEQTKKQNGSAEDVVMIDVSKPIQLSQNSLIVVNGQKCILQQDVKTGQVIAYPVQEPNKLHRRRGRPRKTETVNKNIDQDSASLRDDITEEDNEKGLLEVINDDGSLVRRSTRKRKTAKTLKDYETGNLKQELGSDVDESSILDDIEIQNRKKKHKPGAKLKKYGMLQQPFSSLPNSAIENVPDKRSRGRPKKQIIAKEPTQAFLVQTADGQTLMLQVPLSSMPSGVSLQEVAQCIANKLNIGLNMANNTTLNCDTTQDVKNTEPNNLFNEDCGLNSKHPIEPLQDHSIGSTTSFQNSNNLIDAEPANDSLDNSSANLYNLEEVIVNTASSTEEHCESTLKCHSENNFLTEGMLDKHFTDVGVINLRSTLSSNILNSNSSLINSTTFMPCVPSNICENQIIGSNMTNNLSQEVLCDKTQEKDDVKPLGHEQLAKDYLMDGEFLRDKVNINLLLRNADISATDSVSQAEIDNCIDVNSSDLQNSKTLDTNSPLKYPSPIYGDDDVHSIQNVSEYVTAKDIKILSCRENHFRSNLTDNDSILKNHAIINSINHDHNFLIQDKYSTVISTNQTSPVTSELNVISTTNNTAAFQPVLPLENISRVLKTSEGNDNTGTSSSVVIPVSDTQHTPEEIVPIVLPSQEKKSKDCKICHKMFSTNEELVQHFKADHPKCFCDECDYMAEHAYVLKRHSLRHSTGGIICSICDKQYKDPYILKMHIKMVHLPAEVLFTCDKCGKVFTRKAHLKRHLRTHEPDRPYKCSLCNYRGCERSDITKHLLVHETPKHKCHICGKSFRHIKNLEIHLKRHFKQRDYKCGICDFYGYTFTDIRKHIERKHAGSKSFNCTDCGLSFKNSETLEAHKKSEQCQMSVLEHELDKKGTKFSDDKNESNIVGEMSFKILDAPQSQTSTPILNECDEGKLETESTVLNTTEGILTTSENGELIIDGFDASQLLDSGALSLTHRDGDLNKSITLVAANGKEYSLTVKTNLNPLNSVLATVSNSNEAAFYLPEIESETCT